MSICLLVATGAAIMFVIWCRDRRCERIGNWARAAVLKVDDTNSPEPSHDLLYHAGQTWIHIHDDQLVTVGATALAANFVGTLKAVELPQEQDRLGSGDVAWTLVANNDRRVMQRIPFAGRVLAVNSELVEDPALLQRSPYREGWILRVQPRDLSRAIHHLVPAAVGAAWLNAVATELSEHFGGGVVGRLFDGTNWVGGFGDRLDDATWDEAEREIFAAAVPRAAHTSG